MLAEHHGEQQIGTDTVTHQIGDTTPYEHCVRVEWPGRRSFSSGYRRHSWGPAPPWVGSLLYHGKDPSGQMYRRNRFYDPATGRFTQEDPIGIAGGLNVYGYANGDPITFSDPYGLAPQQCPPCPDGPVGAAQVAFREGVNRWVEALVGGAAAAVEGVVEFLPTTGLVQMATGRNTGGDRLTTGEWALAALGTIPGGGASGGIARFDWKAAGHIFQNAVGHVRPRTLSSRRRFAALFEAVANNPANRYDAVVPSAGLRAGKQGYAQVFQGGQVWVHVINGRITDAGVNLPGAFR